jgi:hypothetical protein
MKKVLATACAMAALTVAAPASAQGILGDLLGGVFGGSSRVGNYDERIRIAYQRGEISDTEARQLQQQYYELREREQYYRQDGLSRDERYDLQRRVSDFERRFEMARRDGDYRDRDRWDDRDRWSNRGDGWCPPGLAKKGNGCQPPGQASRSDSRYRDSDSYRYRDADRYVWQRDRDGRMVQVDRRTGRVVAWR